ncbi:MAG: polysaccharide biosynthesis/export family protein [Tateyamaria sp.]|nr:polysaccharide biosynthesis/export family protein [Tateyamaria sp.]
MKKILVIASLVQCLYLGCAKVLEEPRLDDSGDRDAQEAIQIKIVPLTSKDIAKLNSTPFSQLVTFSKGPVTKASLLGVSAPPVTSPIIYKIGAGDVLELNRITTASATNLLGGQQLGGQQLGSPSTSATNGQSSISSSIAQVSENGTILFPETGLISVEGRTLSEARQLVSNALIRNGLSDRNLQLEIIEYVSQAVSFTVISDGSATNPAGSKVVPITKRPLSIRELIVSSGLSINRGGLQIVTLQRSGKSYVMPIDYVFAARTPEYYLTDRDLVKVESHVYAQQVAYTLGGGSVPQAIPVKLEERPTLSNALFARGGLLSSREARKWEIYMLRGNGPVTAYHLDATNPGRLLIAARVELRPNDIIFATTKPIYAANEIFALTKGILGTATTINTAGSDLIVNNTNF